MTALRFSAFVALLATATASPAPSAGSAGERALFGSCYGEACLFGSSTHLFGAPKPTANASEEKEKDTTTVIPVKATKTEQLEGANLAFVKTSSTPPATAFINHHPLYASPLN